MTKIAWSIIDVTELVDLNEIKKNIIQFFTKKTSQNNFINILDFH